MQVKHLKQNPKNPRKVSKKRLESLKKTTAAFGDLGGIVFNQRSGNLISGHQRVKTLPAAASIEWDDSGEYGYVVIDQNTRFSIRRVDWDEKTEVQAMLAANNSAGEWDTDLLRLNLKEINTIDLTGFELEDLNKFNIDLELKDEPQRGSDSGAGESIGESSRDNQETKAYQDTAEQTEVVGKRFVLIIDCGNQETKDALREKFRVDIEAVGAKIF